MSQFSSGIMFANTNSGSPFGAQLLYRKESDNVCDTNDERNLSSGPTERTAYIMWVKNKSCDVRTKDQHATTRTGDAVRSGDLQALQENSSAGFKRGLKKPSTDYAEYLCNLWMAWEEGFNYSSPSGLPAPSPSAGAAAGTTIGSRGGITISWPPTMSGNSSRSRSLP